MLNTMFSTRKNTIVILCVIIAALAVGGVVWYKQEHSLKTSQTQGKVLADKDRHLTADQEKIYTDRIKKAEDNLQSLNAADPNAKNQQVNDYIYLGQQYFGLGQLETSKESYLKVLQIDSGNESAFVGLAVTYTDAGDLQDARVALETALKNNPKNYNVWLQYIGVRQAMGASSQDINSLYGQALLNTDRYVDVLTKDAEFQESIGNISQAISLWQEAAQKNPDGKQSYNQEIARLQQLKK